MLETFVAAATRMSEAIRAALGAGVTTDGFNALVKAITVVRSSIQGE